MVTTIWYICVKSSSVASYHLPVLAQPPQCPDYAGQTWHDSVQRVADSHPTGWSGALGHSFSVLEGLGLQSSRDSYPCFHPPALSLVHSAAILADKQPADTSLQPARIKCQVLCFRFNLFIIFCVCVLPIFPVEVTDCCVLCYAPTSITGSWLYSFRRSRTTGSPIAPKASPTIREGRERGTYTSPLLVFMHICNLRTAIAWKACSA